MAATEPIVAVLDLDLRHVAVQQGATRALVGEDADRLTGVSLRSLVRDGGALDEALAPVLPGEIDFRSVELEVLADGARVALHVAMVRRDDATPRGVVLVAHPVPALVGRLIRSAVVPGYRRLGSRDRARRRARRRSRSPASARPRTRRRRGAPPARSAPRPPSGRSPTPGSTPADIDGITWSGAFADFDVDAFHEHFGTTHDMWTSPWGGGMAWAATAPVPRRAGDRARARRGTCSTCSRSRGRRSARR